MPRIGRFTPSPRRKRRSCVEDVDLRPRISIRPRSDQPASDGPETTLSKQGAHRGVTASPAGSDHLDDSDGLADPPLRQRDLNSRFPGRTQHAELFLRMERVVPPLEPDAVEHGGRRVERDLRPVARIPTPEPIALQPPAPPELKEGVEVPEGLKIDAPFELRDSPTACGIDHPDEDACVGHRIKRRSAASPYPAFNFFTYSFHSFSRSVALSLKTASYASRRVLPPRRSFQYSSTSGRYFPSWA